jgi:hypothetical protein
MVCLESALGQKFVGTVICEFEIANLHPDCPKPNVFLWMKNQPTVRFRADGAYIA